MAWSNVQCEVEDGVARIKFIRPDRRNVLSRALLSEFVAAVEYSVNADARLLIIEAEGDVFSSGGDLSDPVTSAGALDALLEQHYHQALRRLMKVPCLSVCVVDGLVVGGACGMVLACDMVVVSERAQFSFPFIKIGLAPDCGLSWLLPRLIGAMQAKRLLLFGETVRGEEAVRMGMASRYVESRRLSEHIEGIIQGTESLDRIATVAAKDALSCALSQELEEALKAECALQLRLGKAPRFAATLEKMARS